MIVSISNASTWNPFYKSIVNELVGDVRFASKCLTFKTHASNYAYIQNGRLISHFKRILRHCVLQPTHSKQTLTENLEIDQYIWAILNTLNSTSVEEVTIDTDANWKSVQAISTASHKVGGFLLPMFCGRGDATQRQKKTLFCSIIGPDLIIV